MAQRDFSRLNELINKMLWFTMQNKLGELSSQRSLNYLQQQMAGWGKQREESARLESERLQQIHQNAIKLAGFQAALNAAKDPSLIGRIKEANVKHELGDLAGEQELRAEINAKIGEMQNANYTAFMAGEADISPDDYRLMVEAITQYGGEDATRLLEFAGQMYRHRGEVGMRGQELYFEAGKEKRIAGGESYKAYESKINRIQNFISGFISKAKQTEAGTSEDLADLIDIDMSKASAVLKGKVTVERLSKALEKLEKLKTKALKNELTDADVNWIDSAWNVFKVSEEIEGGENEAEIQYIVRGLMQGNPDLTEEQARAKAIELLGRKGVPATIQ